MDQSLTEALTFLALVAREPACAPALVVVQLHNAHSTVETGLVVAGRPFVLRHVVMRQR